MKRVATGNPGGLRKSEVDILTSNYTIKPWTSWQKREQWNYFQFANLVILRFRSILENYKLYSISNI